VSIDAAPALRHTFRMAKAPASETPRLLAHWIESNGLTQQRAADLIGVNLRQIQYWLNGGTPQKKNVEKLAQTMELQVDDFYSKPDPIAPDILSRLEVVEGQFQAGFEDLDERLSAVEQLLASAQQGDGKAARQLLGPALESLLADGVAPTLAQRRSGRAAKSPAARSRRAASRSSDE
jgi:transcriptional regulator with XRE-family HTH domain